MTDDSIEGICSLRILEKARDLVLEKGGTLALAGIYMTPIPSLDYTLDLFHERTLQSVTANTRQDGLDLLHEAATIPIRTHTTVFPLEQANTALQELKAGTIQGAAVLSIAP